LGHLLKRLRRNLLAEQLKHKKSSKHAQHLRRADKWMLRFKAALDDYIFVQFPDREYQVKVDTMYGDSEVEPFSKQELKEVRQNEGKT